MYTILEMQTNNGVTTVLPATVKETRPLAEQEYHSKLSFAAVSTVEIHTVVMMNAEGAMIKGECYKHEAPAAEPEEAAAE